MVNNCFHATAQFWNGLLQCNLYINYTCVSRTRLYSILWIEIHKIKAVALVKTLMMRFLCKGKHCYIILLGININTLFSILILSLVATFKFLLEWSYKSPLSMHISLIYPNVLTSCSVILSAVLNNITKLKQAVMVEPIEWLDRCSQYSDWATGWTTEESWFNSLLSQETFLHPNHPDQLWGQPSILFSGKWVHLYPNSKVARMWSWPFTFIYSLSYRCV
jgi:hypothetical protein